jgi:hypothetical protein
VQHYEFLIIFGFWHVPLLIVDQFLNDITLHEILYRIMKLVCLYFMHAVGVKYIRNLNKLRQLETFSFGAKIAKIAAFTTPILSLW